MSSDQEKSSEGRIEQEKLAESKESYHDFIQRFKELRKTDPFQVNEHLQLNSEEATYLAVELDVLQVLTLDRSCLLYTSPSPRDATLSRMPSSA